jgi:WD40 repeat protein
MWIETSTMALRTLVLSVVLLAGCTPFREAVAPPGAAPARSETRGPPTAPIARIEPGGHTAPIKRIDTDAAGRILVTGSDDKTVRLWSLADGTLLKILRVPIGGGDEGKVYAVAISGRAYGRGRGSTGYEWDGLASIYLFEVASGRLVKRLAGLPDVINDLNYSQDGQYLAAGLGLKNGIRVYRTPDWEPVYSDPDYGDSCYSVDFAADGRLVSTSYDGHMRLYVFEGEGFRRAAKEKAPGGNKPYTARFSPDGRQIAVGFDGTTAVNVIDGQSLTFRFAPETRDVDNGDLSKVAWSQDGKYLYGGGRFDRAGLNPIRRWDEAGRGSYRDLPASHNTIMDLESLADGRLGYGAQDPAFGVFDATGRKVLDRPSGIADLRGMGSTFLLSPDGRTAQFGFEQWGERPARFSLDARRIDTWHGKDASLRPPRTRGAGAPRHRLGGGYARAQAERQTAGAGALREVPQPRPPSRREALPPGHGVALALLRCRGPRALEPAHALGRLGRQHRGKRRGRGRGLRRWDPALVPAR